MEGKNKTDLTITEYVEKIPGWFGRELGRFFTFRWKAMGSDKWRARVDVSNNCDTAQKWQKNIIFDIRQKNKPWNKN